MEKGKFYIVRETWMDNEQVLLLDEDHSFLTEEEAKQWANEAHWPSDYLVLVECKSTRG